MITRDEWLRALTEAGVASPDVDDQDAVTIIEFQEMFGLPRNTAAFKLRALVTAGKATETRKVVLNSYGRRQSLKAWRLT